MDLKGSYQAKADELALEKFGKDFYELSEFSQHKLYEEAIEIVNDSIRSQADSPLDSSKKKGLR